MGLLHPISRALKSELPLCGARCRDWACVPGEGGVGWDRTVQRALPDPWGLIDRSQDSRGPGQVIRRGEETVGRTPRGTTGAHFGTKQTGPHDARPWIWRSCRARGPDDAASSPTGEAELYLAYGGIGCVLYRRDGSWIDVSPMEAQRLIASGDYADSPAGPWKDQAALPIDHSPAQDRTSRPAQRPDSQGETNPRACPRTP
jgi:hypothetical protein